MIGRIKTSTSSSILRQAVRRHGLIDCVAVYSSSSSLQYTQMVHAAVQIRLSDCNVSSSSTDHSCFMASSLFPRRRPLGENLNNATSFQRFFSTSDSSTPTSPMEQTQSFLLSLGYTKEVSQGIINALLQNGISPNMLFGMVKTLAGRYEIGEDAGLDALADSVKAEQLTKHGMKKVRIVCLPSTGWSSPSNDADDDASLPIIHSMDRAFVVEATEGTTLTDVAKFGTSDNCDVLGEYLECACSGIMACSTCHVVIHPDWYDASLALSSSDTVQQGGMKKIGPPSEAEQDMIDLAFEPQVTSRLGCQIELTTDLDGLVILLPRGSNNLMDHIPFE
jgi:ferredoxin